ncbi:uncharacterized protein chas isoform X1 [Drosophila tropicalis]|uniref:uncharacterized protein chas isoform X1 n=1 Tax=Drosophila tropicalis TaxID=46794 RepID=UPI0035ABB2DF
MVVILLLSPCTCSSRSSISSHIQQQQQHHQPAPQTDLALDSTTNSQQEHGCSSSSSISNVSSSASTGDTAIPASYLRQQQLQYQRQRQQFNHTQSGRPSHSHSYQTALPPRASATGPAPPPAGATTTTANAVPKPPRIHATSFAAAPSPRIFRIYTQSLPLPPANYNNNNNNNNTNNNNINTATSATATTTTTTDYVRHVTRVNFYDIDTSQVEFEPKDDEESNEATSTNCDTEAITKEEEWITKRKTELTTTRQIETRVKRQVKLQDGKVIEDSGPIVSTNTTEDTDKQETETTEKRDLGLPDDLNGNAQLIDVAALEAGAVNEQELAQLQETFGPPSGPVGPAGGPAAGGLGKLVKRMVPRPVDGLVRQVDDKRVISHEEIKDYHETEDVKHLGDFTDETYVNAVRDGVEDLEAALCSPESQRALVPLCPKVIANRSKSRKTIDSEDTQKRCLAQEDGTLVTESKQTTEHELIVDDELPEEEAEKANALLGEQVTTTASNQRYFKQRDEQHVDVVANGKLVSTEMRYAAETTQMDKDGGDLERPGDWDSLSARMRKLRRSQQQQQKEVALLADRKDALTKRPLDFDREEETRKGETMKWLESHFGSESTASNDSRDDVDAEADVEPTKKSYFNVTIKSQSQPNYVSASQQQPHHHHHHHHPQTLPRSAERERDRERERVTPLATAATLERKAPSSGGAAGAGAPAGRSKYFQGISNWSDRKEIGASTANHFSSQAFREDLQETVRRNGLKNSNKNTKPSGGPGSSGSIKPGGGSVNNNHEVLAKDSYVSREDILQQKRQSLSSQFLARSMRGSRDALDDLEAIPGPGPGPNQLRSNQSEEASYKRSAYRQNIVNSNNTHMNGNGQPSINGVGSNPLNGLRGKSYEPSPPPPPPSAATPAAMEYSGNGSNNRPTVPQRRRAIEKKLGEQSSNLIHAHAPSRSASGLVPTSSVSQLEPPPDYSPPPRSRSRSSSPQVDYPMTRPPPEPSSSREMPPSSTMTLSRKQQQRTRFAPTSSYPPVSSTGTLRPGNGTTSASTSNLSALSGSKPSRMGQVIGNSLRKLVSKIRSASAERKFRMKSASNKSREQSPSPGTGGNPFGVDGNGMTTYQQYNVIDGHIGGGGGTRHHSSNDSEDSTSDNQRRRGERERLDRVERQPLKPESQSSGRLNFKRAESADPQLQLSPRQRYYLGEDPYSSSLYGKENIYERRPRQRYDQNREHGEQRDDDFYETSRGPAPPPPPPVTSSHTLGRYQKHGQRFSGSTPNLNLHQDYRSAQTLPRKLHEQRKQPLAPPPPTNRVMNGMNSTNYVQASGNPGSASGPVSIQTGPRSIGSGVVPSVPTGPAKPARTYAKVLNRSKSFNVHGMNGGNDPSPIYIEKLTRNNYPSNGYQISGGSSRPDPAPGLAQSSAYKSQPHLFSSGKDNSLKSGLKSPSIVNLISRSQKDLTKIAGNDDEQDDLSLTYHHPHETESKKQLYLRGLHQQAPDLYRVLHGHEEDQHHQQYGRSPAPGPPTKYPLQPKYSLDSRSSAPAVELNKDTASIVRRSSEVDSKRLIYADEPVVHHHNHHHHQQQQQHHHHHPHVQHHLQHSQQQQHLPHHQHLRRGSGATIIELRNRK